MSRKEWQQYGSVPRKEENVLAMFGIKEQITAPDQ
jgi:hypothetical protein